MTDIEMCPSDDYGSPVTRHLMATGEIRDYIKNNTKMKKIIVLIIAFWGGSQTAVSQYVDHTDGGDFQKRIEYNQIYNTKSKSIYERIFFGDTNSFIEFVYVDPSVASAFRIIRDTRKDSYRMEVLQIPDTWKYYSRVRDLSAGINEIAIPQTLQSQIPLDVMAVVHRHNKELRRPDYVDSLLKPYRPEPKKQKVSKAFAEKLHGTMALLIDSFKAEGIPPLISDGNTATFRCVVGAEIWTLTIHVPQRRALQLMDICLQIITDGCDKKINERKYIEMLDEIYPYTGISRSFVSFGTSQGDILSQEQFSDSSQSGVELDCNLNLESIFKVHNLKMRYEAVDYVYNAREKNNKFIFFKDSSSLNGLFELISGFPMESKEEQDSILRVKSEKTVGFDEAVRLQKDGIKPGELVEVEWMSEEEMDSYIEQLNCTPEKAHKEYRELIRDIKSEKEIYLQCIDTELAKGDLSEYAKEGVLYKFLEPGMSIIGPPWKFTKLDFLKVFKEFVINDNERVLPDGMRVHAYLKCGCKIP
jgi:hypothetical protein